jgi:hypothetical protein
VVFRGQTFPDLFVIFQHRLAFECYIGEDDEGFEVNAFISVPWSGSCVLFISPYITDSFFSRCLDSSSPHYFYSDVLVGMVSA